MSAYIVDDEVIDTLASAIVNAGLQRDLLDNVNILVNQDYYDVAQTLLEQNYRSVNYRYNEDTPTPKFNYQNCDLFGIEDNGKIYSAIHEYNYQSCETEDYYSSKIYRVLRRLEDEMLLSYIRRDNNATKNGWVRY